MSDDKMHFAPVAPEDQGIDSGWFLSEGLDLILEWRPANIAAVLRGAI